MAEKTGKKILIVEDEVTLSKVLSDALVVDGFDVIRAMDGEAGLKSALENKPDLILLDIVMPKMDGLSVLDALRKSGEWGKTVPIVMLTNLNADDRVMDSVVKNEPSYYLEKTDWNIQDVMEKVRERLGLPVL